MTSVGFKTFISSNLSLEQVYNGLEKEVLVRTMLAMMAYLGPEFAHSLSHSYDLYSSGALVIIRQF